MEQLLADTSSLPSQAAVFRSLRWRLLRNTLQGALSGSRLRVLLIVVCSALIWGGIFAGSAECFNFLFVNRIPLVGGIIGLVFDFLFMALALLLLFSNAIILYSSLFSAAETSFLLSTPAAPDRVFAYKFQGAVTFSSWAFVLLGSPVLIAFGLAFNVPWYFYALLPYFVIGFILLPGSIGALSCLLIVNYMPRRPKQVLAAFFLAIVGFIAVWIWHIRPSSLNEALHRDFIQNLLGQFSILQSPLSPIHWLTRGLQAAARGDVGSVAYSLALLWSNGLMLYLLMTVAASRMYRRGVNRMATGGSLRRRYGGAWLDRSLASLVAFLDPQTRLLIVKDFRIFRRDPAQWAQVLIFTGLTILYFTNVRRFYQEETLGQTYQNAVSIMNLTATGLLLCAYTGRFIFPMLSLEGRKFWILGLLPLARARLLWGKFVFSATWSVLVSEFLVTFSDWMLGVPGFIIGVHVATVLVIALGLSGLSVGLGAWMPNFRESDPSKIAVGFGGTLNLVTGLFFLTLVIALMAGPWHWRMIYLQRMQTEPFSVWWLGVGELAGLVTGGLAVAVPLVLGVRALKRMEF